LTSPLIVPLIASVDSSVDRKPGTLARGSLTHLQTINGCHSKPTNCGICVPIKTINGAINGHPLTHTPVDRNIVCVGVGFGGNTLSRLLSSFGGPNRQRLATKSLVVGRGLASKFGALIASVLASGTHDFGQIALAARQHTRSARFGARETSIGKTKKEPT
jgi:hypothetical protein